MCGIVGYIGFRDAYPIVIKGLHRLEYRGYDSAGISLLNEKLKVYKKGGKVSDLENFVKDLDLHATIGIRQRGGRRRACAAGEGENDNE